MRSLERFGFWRDLRRRVPFFVLDERLELIV
jgi:hypothetical protein